MAKQFETVVGSGEIILPDGTWPSVRPISNPPLEQVVPARKEIIARRVYDPLNPAAVNGYAPLWVPGDNREPALPGNRKAKFYFGYETDESEVNYYIPRSLILHPLYAGWWDLEAPSFPVAPAPVDGWEYTNFDTKQYVHRNRRPTSSTQWSWEIFTEETAGYVKGDWVLMEEHPDKWERRFKADGWNMNRLAYLCHKPSAFNVFRHYYTVWVKGSTATEPGDVKDFAYNLSWRYRRMEPYPRDYYHQQFTDDALMLIRRKVTLKDNFYFHADFANQAISFRYNTIATRRV